MRTVLGVLTLAVALAAPAQAKKPPANYWAPDMAVYRASFHLRGIVFGRDHKIVTTDCAGLGADISGHFKDFVCAGIAIYRTGDPSSSPCVQYVLHTLGARGFYTTGLHRI